LDFDVLILFEASGAVFLKVDVSSASFLAQEDRLTLPLAKKGGSGLCGVSRKKLAGKVGGCANLTAVELPV
jgi:hypothetical protein